MSRRMLSLTATLSAVLCLTPASLAFAGEDDPVPPPPPVEQPLPQPVPVVPQPVPEPVPEPAPAPVPAPQPPPVAAPAPAPAPTPVRHTVRKPAKAAPVSHTTLQTTQPVARTIQVSTVPVAGVQAGGGAMADAPSQAGLLGLGAGLLLVATAGGGLALARRREDG